MRISRVSRTVGAVLCAATAIVSRAQSFATVSMFDGRNGMGPGYMTPTQAPDGNLYGTTLFGGKFLDTCGPNGCGLIFGFEPSTLLLTTPHLFCSVNEPNNQCLDGYQPFSGLFLGTDAKLYGTTFTGGANEGGTLFNMMLKGKLTTMYNFCSQRKGILCLDGDSPQAGVTQSFDGYFYGATSGGGGNNGGTIFRTTSNGTGKILYNFGLTVDGREPESAPVVGYDGNLYGTTTQGGQNQQGVIYRTSSQGFSVLYTFCTEPNCADGAIPYPELIAASDGDLYGSTEMGGASGAGTIYKIDLNGQLTTLYSFCSASDCSDGMTPTGRLVEGSDGQFYGTTSAGGLGGKGTVFSLAADGTLTTLYAFCVSGPPCADGAFSDGGLIQYTNGKFYGTTAGGGNYVCDEGCGTIFSLDVGLDPFVALVNNQAKVGQPFGILGQGFTGATSVSLNGTPVSFKVALDTFIEATVPAGATTGYVTVTTPSGMLTSNVPFHVLQ